MKPSMKALINVLDKKQVDDLKFHYQMRKPAGTWPRRAQSTILSALGVWWRGSPDPQADNLADHVNAFYPFGERAMAPYKAWLKEMEALGELAALLFQQGKFSREMADLLEIARDAETEGEPEEVVLKLLAQVDYPILLEKCRICGAVTDAKCIDLDSQSAMLVPHTARLPVVPLAIQPLDHGPLFALT